MTAVTRGVAEAWATVMAVGSDCAGDTPSAPMVGHDLRARDAGGDGSRDSIPGSVRRDGAASVLPHRADQAAWGAARGVYGRSVAGRRRPTTRVSAGRRGGARAA